MIGLRAREPSGDGTFDSGHEDVYLLRTPTVAATREPLHWLLSYPSPDERTHPHPPPTLAPLLLVFSPLLFEVRDSRNGTAATGRRVPRSEGETFQPEEFIFARRFMQLGWTSWSPASVIIDGAEIQSTAVEADSAAQPLLSM